MTPMLLLCVSLSNWTAGEQVQELRRLADASPAARAIDRLAARGQFPLAPGLRPTDWEAFNREFLESCRRSRDIWKREVAWHEREVADLEALLRPWMDGRLRPSTTQNLERVKNQMRQNLEECRAEFKRHETWVRELERYEELRQLKPGREADAAFERLEKLRQELWGEPKRAVAPMPREKK